MDQHSQSMRMALRSPWSEHKAYRLAWLIGLGALIYFWSSAVPGRTGPSGWAFPEWSPHWPFMFYCMAGYASLLLASRAPAVPYIAYLVLAYGVIPRSHMAADFLRATGMLEIVLAVGLVNSLLCCALRLPQNRLARGILLTTAIYCLWTWLVTAYWAYQSGNIAAQSLRECVRTTECLALTLAFASVPFCREKFLATIHVFLAAFLLEVAIAWPTLSHDAVTATVGVLCLPFMGFALAESSHACLRIHALASITLALLAVYRAESRAVLGGAAVALLSWIALSNRRGKQLAILFASMILLGYFALTGPLGIKFQLLLRHEPGWDSGRLPLWTQAWDAFRQHPWIGSGPGAPSGPLNSAHNSYLSALSELGLIGCGLYILIGGLTLIQLALLLRSEAPTWQKRLVLALISTIMAQGTIGWGYSLQNWQLTYAFVGLTLAVQRSASSDQLASDGI